MTSAILLSLRAAVITLALGLAANASAQLESISRQDAVSALKAALEKGSQAAAETLGRPDGFLANDKVRIALPDSLARYEKLMRRFGMGHYADELIVAMNRAAEQAVPEARKLLVDSVRKMSVQDAKGILTGGETAGTEYFRRTTSEPLRKRFLPIVQEATARVGVAQKYNQYAQQGAALGLLKKEHANLDDYVTQKALDGLFLMIAEEEQRIRKDPIAAGSDIIRRVFGALR